MRKRLDECQVKTACDGERKNLAGRSQLALLYPPPPPLPLSHFYSFLGVAGQNKLSVSAGAAGSAQLAGILQHVQRVRYLAIKRADRLVVARRLRPGPGNEL